MKKLLLIVLLMFVCSQIQAQTKQVKITMKNGVTVKGELKELNPMSHAIIVIAGIESKIQMSDVESIEELSSSSSIGGGKESVDGIDTKQYGEYNITDNNQYPESFDITIGGDRIKMVLVRGGMFNMGYDGRGSLGMKSEPIHKVTLSSYYISETPLYENTAFKLLGMRRDSKDRFFSGRWKLSEQILEKIVSETRKPYRLLTEAEWEYASLMPNADEIWGKEDYLEWCSDFMGPYPSQSQTNPRGPGKGDEHVMRSYRMGKTKWDRKIGDYLNACFRIAISADAIK